MATNFVSYENLTTIVTAIGQKFAALNGAYVIKGNSTFANLPETPTVAQDGFVYNVTDNFTTDARFIEGAGKKYPANTNVVIANTGTSQAPNMKYDVISSFIDVDAIMNAIKAVADMIAPKFSTSATYAIGDICVKENILYKFTSAHSAGAWDSSQVTAVTIDDLLDTLQTSINTLSTNLTNVREMICDNNFNTTTAYEVGNIVVYENGLYVFKSAHTAGAWDSTEVDEVTVLDLISAAEPDPLTPQEVTALINLLG